jgi:hypothetical protein
LSPTLHEMVVQTGAVLPFAQAARQVGRLTGSVVSAATVRRLTEQAGAAYAAVQEAALAELEAAPAAPPGSTPVPDVLQMSADGAMVRLVGGAWEEVKTVAIGVLPPDRETGHARALSYFSRLADHHTFSRLAVVEAERRGIPRARCVCAVNDGAEWIQQFIDDHRPDAVRILDWAHAVSYLSTIAQAAYGAGTLRAASWLEQQQQVLRQHSPEQVLAAVQDILEQGTAQGMDTARMDIIAGSLAYLDKRVDQMRYAR